MNCSVLTKIDKKERGVIYLKYGTILKYKIKLELYP